MAQGINISMVCLDFIRNILPEGKTILEFGSGLGSTWLGESYKMYSVENQPEWFDRYPESTTYINCRTKQYDNIYTVPSDAPDNKAWYHPDDLFPNLPSKYDLILIDGPASIGHGCGRAGFLKHIDKFNTDVPMIFDDINRQEDFIVMKITSDYVGREYTVLDDGYTGVIRGKS